MLVNEVLARHLRDRKSVARYAGLTGSPDEIGTCNREGVARAGNARVFPEMASLRAPSCGRERLLSNLSKSSNWIDPE
jgi:hypothetical protein